MCHPRYETAVIHLGAVGELIQAFTQLPAEKPAVVTGDRNALSRAALAGAESIVALNSCQMTPIRERGRVGIGEFRHDRACARVGRGGNDRWLCDGPCGDGVVLQWRPRSR